MRKLLMGLFVWIMIATFSMSALAKKELTMWYHSGQERERAVIAQQIKDFNAKEKAFSIKGVEIPEGSYNSQVQAAALARKLPDILELDGPYLAGYAASGYLLPLDKYVSATMKNDFLSSIIAQGTYRNKLYSLGVFDSGLAIWGNKKYLKEAGIRIPTSVDDAWTFAEFNDNLKKLKALPNVKWAIDLKINWGRGEWFTYGFSPIFQAFGADLIDRKTMASAKGVLNSSEAIAAATWFQGLFTQGYANPNPAGDNDFINGDAAFSWVVHGVWPTYSKALGDDLVLIPMPKFPKGQATGMGSWCWAISAKCKDPRSAWKMLDFILQPAEIIKMTSANGAVPARTSAATLTNEYKAGGQLNIYVQQLKKIAIPRPVTPVYPILTNYFAEAIDNIIRGGDVKTILDNAVRKIDLEIEVMQ